MDAHSPEQPKTPQKVEPEETGQASCEVAAHDDGSEAKNSTPGVGSTSASFRQPSGVFGQPSGSFRQPSGVFGQSSGSFRQPSMRLSQPGGIVTPNPESDVFLHDILGVEIGRDVTPDYRVGDEIGRGGCAVVYEAWRLSDEMHVVIKVLHSTIPMTEDEARVAIKRFMREAEVISSLHETHIVKCVDYGSFYGTPCMVLEFVDGLPLDKLLAKMGPLSLAHATGIIEQLLEALEETHSKEVIHRDIKPSNIMVFDSPPPYEIRVLDFGIASVYDKLQQSKTLLTQQGSVRGTPSYMAPELFTGESKASREADLYAAGLVYLEMLTGKIAFDGENFMRVAYKQVNQELDIPGSIPSRIADIICKMCAKDVAKRYHTAREVLDDIHANLKSAIAEEEKCAREWEKGISSRGKKEKKRCVERLAHVLSAAKPRSDANSNTLYVYVVWSVIVLGLIVSFVLVGLILYGLVSEDDAGANSQVKEGDVPVATPSVGEPGLDDGSPAVLDRVAAETDEASHVDEVREDGREERQQGESGDSIGTDDNENSADDDKNVENVNNEENSESDSPSEHLKASDATEEASLNRDVSALEEPRKDEVKEPEKVVPKKPTKAPKSHNAKKTAAERVRDELPLDSSVDLPF